MNEEINYHIILKCPLCNDTIPESDTPTYIDIRSPNKIGTDIHITCCETCGTQFKSAVLSILNKIKGE